MVEKEKKDEQTYVEKIYIHSRIATASKEQWEKQSNISKTKSPPKKTHQEKRKKNARKIKKKKDKA